MTVFLTVWNSHYTRVRFTVIGYAVMSLQFNHAPPLPAEAVANVASGLFYCWSLLRNNNMAKNLQKFPLYYSSRRFVAWDCWTHTSWQVMQRDSDKLIAVNHVHLYFLKRSLSKSTQVWKHSFLNITSTSLKHSLLVRVWPMCLSVKLRSASFFSCSIK